MKQCIQYIFEDVSDVGYITTCIADMKDKGLKVDVYVKEHQDTDKRNLAQNNFYWLNCSDLAQFFNDAGLLLDNCYLYTAETIHDFNKQIFGVKTTTKMTVSEFSDYMNRIFEYWRNKTRNFWHEKESINGYLERTGLLKEIENENS